MSTGLYTHTTRATGTILTAAIYNSDHQNHITNSEPSMIGALSDSVGEFQGTTDPGGISSENLAGSLAEELQMLRFVIKRFIGADQWYEDVGQGAQTDSSNIFSITQAIVSDIVNLILNRTENDTTEREILSVRSGDGSGDRLSHRIVGDGANSVAELRRYIDTTEVDRLTETLMLFNIAIGVGAGLRLNSNGYVDVTEIATPADPATNVGRIYVRDDGNGATILAYRDSAGTEHILRAVEAVGALLGILEDQKTQGTNAGAFSSNDWETRVLNTEVYDRLSILSLSSNEFTISAAGTYEIEWSCPAAGAGGNGPFNNKSRLYNVTGAAVVAYGESQYVGGTSSGSEASGSTSRGIAVVTIAGSTTFRVEHKNAGTSTQLNKGFATNDGTEVYARVIIRRGA